MSIEIRKSFYLIEDEVKGILHKHFLDNDLVKPKRHDWYYTQLTFIKGWRARLYFHNPNEYMLQGIIKYVIPERKELELLSYSKEFTEIAKGLNEKIPDFKIIIEERFND